MLLSPPPIGRIAALSDRVYYGPSTVRSHPRSRIRSHAHPVGDSARARANANANANANQHANGAASPAPGAIAAPSQHWPTMSATSIASADSMADSPTSDALPTAMLASSVTDTDDDELSGLMSDAGSDAQIYIKDESLSPTGDDEHALFYTRDGVLKSTSHAAGPVVPAQRIAQKGSLHHQHATKAGIKNMGKTMTVSVKGARGSATPSPHARVPRRAEDWEPWKSVLHDLYITQNRILRDIILIMETKYNLKATPKMYKNQFARWGFFKYAVKRRPRSKTESPTEQTYEGTLIIRRDSSDDDKPTLSFLFPHKGTSRSAQIGISAVRRFLRGHLDLDANHLRLEEVTGFIDPCYRYFKTAMDLFDLGENVDGGRVLRLAFLQIDRKIDTPSLKSFSDLCFLVPHLLLESGRPDILTAYLRYLARLATVKFGSNHPLADIAAAFADMMERPEDLMRCIMMLSRANADAISGTAGMLDRTRRWARNQYLACQNTNGPDEIAAGAERHPHHMIRLEAQSVYWAQHLLMQDSEGDALAEEWLKREFSEDFAPRCKALLEQLRARVAAGEFAAIYSSMMECLYIGWLSDYYETVEDWPTAFEWGKKGLALSVDEQYLIWSIHIERLMRKHGFIEDADELLKQRKEHQWLEVVKDQVDKLTLTN